MKNILENFLSKMAKLVEMYVIKEINNLWYYMIVTTIYDNTCDGIIGFDIDFKVEWSCKSENLKNSISFGPYENLFFRNQRLFLTKNNILVEITLNYFLHKIFCSEACKINSLRTFIRISPAEWFFILNCILLRKKM